MKVLMLSVTAGYGHHQTAKSIMSYLKNQGVESDMLDVYKYINPILSESVSKTYLLSTKFTPKTYGRVYRLAEKKMNPDRTSIFSMINAILSKNLLNFISNYNPDVIVCTHIFAAQIMTYLKAKDKLNIPCIGIVTDFTVHPFWEESNMEYYVCASELLLNQFRKKSIQPYKILTTGIPILEKFSIKMDKQAARKVLGIKDKKTLLVMTGSMGFGNVLDQLKLVDELEGDFQILCVCGYNEKLRNQISKSYWQKDMHVFGFVNNVDIMMDACDCIITKPGGLTASEVLAKGIAAILIDPIPGQEDRNAEFFVNNGLAVKTSPTFPLDEAIYQVLFFEEHLESLRRNARAFGKPNSSKDLGDFIINLAYENTAQKNK